MTIETHEAEAVILGAIYDFAGKLTTGKSITLGGAENATPVLDAITEWAKDRGLSMDEAHVQDWGKRIGLSVQ